MEKKSEDWVKSFIYIKNNNGPKIDPWGTPEEIGMVPEMLPFTKTLCFLLLRYDLNQSIWGFWMP